MSRKHIAVIVESSYGHFVSVVGIVTSLTRLGYRVSCAVSEHFAAGVRAIGAEPVIYKPSMSKMHFFAEMLRPDGSYAGFQSDPRYERWRRCYEEEIRDNRTQLGSLYRSAPPEAVIYDVMTAGFAKELANGWGARILEHSPLMISVDFIQRYDDQLILVSMPKSFQPDADRLDRRFQFIGFSPLGRRSFFHAWKPSVRDDKVILVSSTTGLLPQVDFFNKVIQAFADRPVRVVLSIGNHLDPSNLSNVPKNFEVNQTASNLEILERASVFIGQGGQGSVLETMYCGVPAIIIPPAVEPDNPFEPVARRVTELRVGMNLSRHASAAELRAAVDYLVHDNHEMKCRLTETRTVMREQAQSAADRAASLIDAHLKG
jgi:UDP:flavonoid glycosyltransferase YjiC (YdhE family)